MMDIAFEKPESLVPEHNKPLAIANADYPLISIDHRRFEKLNYWVFRTEIENGGWKGKYQDIRLMSGVSDGGKDCAIYNDDVLVAVIQCKHSENNNALTVPIFLKEIIKFGIYWTQDNSIVPDPSNFEYYISSSSGFNEDCTNLIADFHKKVTEIKELGKYANSVINSYASLKDINYTTIEVALKDFFALITVIKIDKEEINRLLTKPYQHLTIKAFFDIKTVIDGVAIEPLKDEIRELGKDIQKITKKSINIDDVLSSFKAASYHLLNWNSFIDSGDKVHIERTQVGPILNWVQSPINEKDKPIALLAGDAGVGKTVVLKAVYQKLLELDIPVLGLKADKLYAGDIEELEKQLDFRESIVDMVKTLRNEHEKVVILVDQIDALSQSLSSDRKFLNAYNLLIQKLAAIQGVRIIISVRSFDLRYDPHLKTLKKNKTFELVPLTDQELKTALSNLAIPFNKLNLRLYNTLKVPHHLYVFCQVYNSSLSLDGIQELQDLYDELWKQKVLSLPHVLKINSTECVQLIYDIADRMNKAEQITVHRKSFEEKYDVVDYLISNNILTSDGNELQFFHQTFYDYSYARHFVESENSVIAYVLQHRHSLHIRSSIKMILSYLKTSNEIEYIESLTKLLTKSNVHFHIKLLVINLLGYNQTPTPDEIRLVKSLLLPNEDLSRYFIESVYGSEWIEVLIEGKIIDTLLNPKKTLADRIMENNILPAILRKQLLPKIFHYITYEKRRTENINLLYLIFTRSIFEARKNIIQYFQVAPDFAGKDVCVRGMLYFLKEWDFPEVFDLYNKHKSNITQDSFSFFHILENVLKYDIDWVIVEIEQYVIDTNRKPINEKLNTEKDYHLIHLFQEIAKQDRYKAFDLGLRLLKEISKTDTFERGELFDDNTFWAYDYGQAFGHDIHDFYTEVIKLAIDFAKRNDPKFSAFFNSNMDCKSITVLKIIVYALRESPQLYTKEIVSFIELFDQKNGFASDGKIQFWIRRLIEASYMFFNQQQRDIINRIILAISKGDVYISETKEGKKTLDSYSYGLTMYKYLQSIPEPQILAQPSLNKIYQEYKRKFSETLKDSEPWVFRLTGVSAPLQPRAYENMSFSQWEESFLKYISEETTRGKGGLLEHSRAFSKYVKNQPGKFYHFIEKLIDEGKVHPDYLISGLEGLKEGDLDPFTFFGLYKKIILMQLDKRNALSVIWLADYLIKHQLIDDEVVDFLIKQAVFNVNPDQNSNPKDPLMDGINSVRGAAIEKLLKCSDNNNFKEKIFSTAEKVAEDNITSVRATLLAYLQYTIKWDEQRAIKVFLRAMSSDNQSLINVSINSLQYLVHHNFQLFLPYLEEWIKYESVQEDLGAILTWCWLKDYKNSFSVLEKLWKLNDKAKAMSVRIAYENLFDPNKIVRDKCKQIFKRFLDYNSKEIVHEYNCMFLHVEEIEKSFEKWLPYLKKYVKSKVAKKNPQYFLEYILGYTARHPKECLYLISNYKSFPPSDITTEVHYMGEPIKIVLNAYTILYNNAGDSLYAKKAVNLFDEMLQVGYLRKEAYHALDLVER